MSENPSERLVEQRIRNRIMDSMCWLAEGAEAVRRMSPQEFFEMFFDWVDDERSEWPWPKGAPETMTPAEVDAVSKVLAVVNAAVADIDDSHDEVAVIASGWLERISPVAKTALELMLARGCFDEDFEESEPSNRTFEALLRAHLN
ncbi:hypothetical protein RNI52_07300 [Labrys neptuniae]|uniref:hypothetical protein n=1 Tax=Labrys neptuniae TaxID=376174 RepID=UPI00288C858C|nr:hypothetical protein [Labrys neptuniae]MDT3377124.1 hypothetical protein [Labrys neptuniae]